MFRRRYRSIVLTLPRGRSHAVSDGAPVYCPVRSGNCWHREPSTLGVRMRACPLSSCGEGAGSAPSDTRSITVNVSELAGTGSNARHKDMSVRLKAELLARHYVRTFNALTPAGARALRRHPPVEPKKSSPRGDSRVHSHIYVPVYDVAIKKIIRYHDLLV